MFRGIGPLELVRTRELIARYLPFPPAVVFDVGGGPGVYSCWLVPEFEERWQDEGQREVLLTVIRWMEREPVALGMSPHIVAVARKPEAGFRDTRYLGLER